MTASRASKTICTLSLSALFAACGGGGSDITLQVPSPAPAPAPAPGPAPAPTPPGGAAWPVPAYEYWIPSNDPNALGTTTVAPDRSFSVSNITLAFNAPYTSGCAINAGLCAERFAARAIMVCPQNQPEIVLVDARAAKVTDLSALNGTTFHAVFGCDNNTTATAAVSASGDLTVTADAVYPLGPLADLVASGRFSVRALTTASGTRHVIVERRTDGFTALFTQD